MNPITKALGIALVVLLVASGALGAGLWYQLKENGALAAREDAQKKRNKELADSMKVMAETLTQANATLSAIQGQLEANQQAANTQLAAINRGIRNGAKNDPAWASGRMPDAVLVELCRSGLVSTAAGLCGNAAPPAGGLPAGAAGRPR